MFDAGPFGKVQDIQALSANVEPQEVIGSRVVHLSAGPQQSVRITVEITFDFSLFVYLLNIAWSRAVFGRVIQTANGFGVLLESFRWYQYRSGCSLFQKYRSILICGKSRFDSSMFLVRSCTFGFVSNQGIARTRPYQIVA